MTFPATIAEPIAELTIKRLRERGCDKPIHYDRQNYCLRVGARECTDTIVINLNSVCASCEGVPRDLWASVVDRYIARAMGSPKTDEISGEYATARAGISLAVKHLTSPTFGMRLKLEDLALYLVHDRGDLLQFLGEEMLGKWGVSLDTAFEDARENLRKAPVVIERIGNVYRLCTHDSFDAARITIDKIFTSLPVRGLPVVLIPDRDCVVFTGSEDIEGLKQMAAIGHVQAEEDQTKSDLLISGRPLVLGNGGWARFQVPPEVSVVYEHLEKVFELRRYDAFRNWLAFMSARRGDKVDVAPAVLGRLADGRYQTVAQWLRPGRTLLPQADRVIFFSDSRKVYSVPWEDLYSVIGHRMTQSDGPQPVYWVDELPNGKECRAMNAAPEKKPRQVPRRPRPSGR